MFESIKSAFNSNINLRLPKGGFVGSTCEFEWTEGPIDIY